MSVDARFSLQQGTFSLSIAMQVAAGETLALLGPNGAGKSTTLRTLAGLHAIDHGHVRIDGELVDDGSAAAFVPPERRDAGVVFQDHLLFPHLTARDNIAFGLRSRGLKTRLARAVATAWLQRVDLPNRGDALPAELSGGQAQRVALARALAGKPRLLLLDEPLAAADASARLELRRTLQAQLRTFPGSCLIVAHDLDDALAIADRIAVMENGRIVQSGSIDELGHRPASRYVADLIGLNCFRGVCHDNVLTVDNGATIVVGVAHEGPVIATLHPRAVALFRERPAGSPRNVWRAPIVGTERTVDCIRVRLGGDLPVIAEVTESAVRDLDLDGGGSVWAAIKATEFRVAPE
jgi:molybdate transport system ATP-binding protein